MQLSAGGVAVGSGRSGEAVGSGVVGGSGVTVGSGVAGRPLIVSTKSPVAPASVGRRLYGVGPFCQLATMPESVLASMLESIMPHSVLATSVA